MTLLAAIAILVGLFMAWNIGANDVANAMSTSVGAKAITLRQALVIAAILDFSGAVLVGKYVTETIKSKLVDTDLLLPSIGEQDIALGFLAALVSASVFVMFATWKELPVSTTHAIIGGVTGFGFVAGGVDAVKWNNLFYVAASWVLSPLAGAGLAFLIFRLMRRGIFNTKDPIARAKLFGPAFIAITVFIISFSVFSVTGAVSMFNFSFEQYMIISLLLSCVAGSAGYWYYASRKMRTDETHTKYDVVEKLFKRLQVMTACYVAFSHGANDVANAIGPLAVILAFSWGTVDTVYLLVLGGIGLVVGILTWGYKVMSTVGTKITSLTNTRGFAVEFATATVVLVCSKLGLPISTSHAIVGSVIGVGLARGLAAVDLGIVKKIVYSWLLTLPVTVVGSILIYKGVTLFL